MANLIQKKDFIDVWYQINRILGLKDSKGQRTSIKDLDNYNEFSPNLKISKSHIEELNNKIEEMKKDSYYKNDTKNYLITYSGDTSTTIKSSLRTYLNNLKTNAGGIKCRNEFSNTHGTNSHGTKENEDKTNGTYQKGATKNSSNCTSRYSASNDNTVKTDNSNASNSYGDKTNGTYSKGPNSSYGTCNPKGTTIDIYCNNKGE